MTRLVLFSAFAALLYAQRGPMVTPAFRALDTDGDGAISAAEIAKAPQSLRSLDKDDDGRLTEEEVRPVFGGRGEGRGGRGPEGEGRGEANGPNADEMVQTLMAFDKNKDGKLTRDEVPERMQGLFDRADANKDGVLTPDEIRSAAQSQARPAGRGEGPDSGREGGRGEGRRDGPPSFMRMDPILAALDANADGVISAEEIANAPAALKKLDTNGDGVLSEDEARPNFGFGRRGPGR